MKKGREITLAILIAFVVLLLNNLPLVYFNSQKKKDLFFLNRRVVNSFDLYTYVSFIEQAKQGRLLFENQYTSEPQKVNLFRPSYLLIGKAASFLNISSIASYHLFRILFSILFFYILYIFLGHFFGQPAKRLLAFTLVLTSCGLGSVLKKWLPKSTDLWVPESITFLSLTQAPHFILSQIMMLSGFHFLLFYSERKKILYLFLSFASFLTLSFEHPFNLAVIIPTIICFSIWSGLSFLVWFLLGLATSSGVLFQLMQTSQNPILEKWQSQNLLLSPSPIEYLSGYGILLVLAIVGIENFFRQIKNQNKLLLAWISSTVILLYAPVNFQRRFIEGLHLPIAIAASSGMFITSTYLQEKFSRKSKNLFTSVFFLVLIAVLGLSSGNSILEDFKEINKDSIDSYYYYLAEPEFKALNWLKNNTGFEDVILANWFYGNFTPGITGRKVFLGHEIQTIDMKNKIEKTNSFLLEPDNQIAFSFLKENRISYIFLGLYDSMLKYGFEPDQKPFLERVYDKEGVLIYKVR